MSVEITGVYLGDKKVRSKHEPSGAEVVTVPPVDNQGDGSSFSPTDLTATSLGACMLALVALVGERDGLELRGIHYRIEKHMQASPRRIAALPIEIHLPKNLNEESRKKLERAALTCPVHQSLLSEIDIPTKFIYDL